MSVRPLHILSVIIVALLLSAVLSCSGRQEQVRQTLTVADSLMMTQPQACRVPTRHSTPCCVLKLNTNAGCLWPGIPP